jgi:transposase-like protein
VLVESSVMDQRCQAVLAVVQDGWQVPEVARRLGLFRRSVHTWIARYRAGGLASLADSSSSITRAHGWLLQSSDRRSGRMRFSHASGSQDPPPGHATRRTLAKHELLRTSGSRRRLFGLIRCGPSVDGRARSVRCLSMSTAGTSCQSSRARDERPATPGSPRVTWNRAWRMREARPSGPRDPALAPTQRRP